MKTFVGVWVLGVIGAVCAGTVVYPERAALLSYSPARGEFPVQSLFGRGFFSYIDESGNSRLEALEPNPLLAVRVSADGQPLIDVGRNLEYKAPGQSNDLKVEGKRKQDKLKPIKEFDEAPFADSLDDKDLTSSIPPDSRETLPSSNPSTAPGALRQNFLFPQSPSQADSTAALLDQIFASVPATGAVQGAQSQGNPFAAPITSQNPSGSLSNLINPTPPSAPSQTYLPAFASTPPPGDIVFPNSPQVFPNPPPPAVISTTTPAPFIATGNPTPAAVFPIPTRPTVFPNPPPPASGNPFFQAAGASGVFSNPTTQSPFIATGSPFAPATSQAPQFQGQPQSTVFPNPPAPATQAPFLAPGNPFLQTPPPAPIFSNSERPTEFPNPPPPVIAPTAGSPFAPPPASVFPTTVFPNPPPPAWITPTTRPPFTGTGNPFLPTTPGAGLISQPVASNPPQGSFVQPPQGSFAQPPPGNPFQSFNNPSWPTPTPQINVNNTNPFLAVAALSVRPLIDERDFPDQVKDTPEVEQAKREHFLAHQKALEQLKAARQQDDPRTESPSSPSHDSSSADGTSPQPVTSAGDGADAAGLV